jgi:hypothetical protein
LNLDIKVQSPQEGSTSASFQGSTLGIADKLTQTTSLQLVLNKKPRRHRVVFLLCFFMRLEKISPLSLDIGHIHCLSSGVCYNGGVKIMNMKEKQRTLLIAGSVLVLLFLIALLVPQRAVERRETGLTAEQIEAQEAVIAESRETIADFDRART